MDKANFLALLLGSTWAAFNISLKVYDRLNAKRAEVFDTAANSALDRADKLRRIGHKWPIQPECREVPAIARARERQVRVELNPAQRPILSRHLHSLAPARRTGRVLARIGIVGQLRVEFLLE